MPYCPKCDMEFVDGITTCSDCGGPLVESKEVADAMKKKEREEALARQRAQYEAMQAEWLAQQQGETTDSEDPEISGDPDSYEGADDGVDKAGDKPDSPENRSYRPNRSTAPTQVYVKKSQQYEDLKSSASAFLLVGGALLILSVLCWTNVIPLPMAGPSRLITQGMMTVMAVGSLLVALQSSHSAKTVAGQVEEEEQATRQLTQWFTENYTGQDLDTRIASEYSELSPEELSLKRFDLIQDILITNHDLADQAYVDLLAEEIYGHLFEE